MGHFGINPIYSKQLANLNDGPRMLQKSTQKSFAILAKLGNKGMLFIILIRAIRFG